MSQSTRRLTLNSQWLLWVQLCKLTLKVPSQAMILTGGNNNSRLKEHSLLVACHQEVDHQQVGHVLECPRVYLLARKDLLPLLMHNQLQRTIRLRFNRRQRRKSTFNQWSQTSLKHHLLIISTAGLEEFLLELLPRRPTLLTFQTSVKKMLKWCLLMHPLLMMMIL